jgi:hypothetical protein
MADSIDEDLVAFSPEEVEKYYLLNYKNIIYCENVIMYHGEYLEHPSLPLE